MIAAVLTDRDAKRARMLLNDDRLAASFFTTVERDGELVQVRSLDVLMQRLSGAPIDADPLDPRRESR